MERERRETTTHGHENEEDVEPRVPDGALQAGAPSRFFAERFGRSEYRLDDGRATLARGSTDRSRRRVERDLRRGALDGSYFKEVSRRVEIGSRSRAGVGNGLLDEEAAAHAIESGRLNGSIEGVDMFDFLWIRVMRFMILGE